MDLRSGDRMKKAMHVILAQLSKDDKHAHVAVKEGIKRYGENALNILLSKFG